MYVRVHVTSERHVTSLVIKGKQDYIGSDLDLWTLGPKANARQQRWLKHVKKIKSANCLSQYILYRTLKLRKLLFIIIYNLMLLR